MQVDITKTVFATWSDNPPTLAQDASSAADLRATMSKLGVTWRRRFSILANEMAKHFALSAAQRVDASLRASLKKAGFAVKFTMTPAMHDAITATTAENVALIKSIPAEHLKNIEGDVMRSVQAGRDLGRQRGGDPLEHEDADRDLWGDEATGCFDRAFAKSARDCDNYARSATRVGGQTGQMDSFGWRSSPAPIAYRQQRQPLRRGQGMVRSRRRRVDQAGSTHQLPLRERFGHRRLYRLTTAPTRGHSVRSKPHLDS